MNRISGSKSVLEVEFPPGVEKAIAAEVSIQDLALVGHGGSIDRLREAAVGGGRAREDLRAYNMASCRIEHLVRTAIGVGC
jgi:hypothetical protein